MASKSASPQHSAMAKFGHLLSESSKDPENYQSHFQLLGHIHKYRLPYPQLVVKYGELLIEQYNPLRTLIDPFSIWGTILGLIAPNLVREHIFDVVEQVCFAAIHCHRYQLRNDCLFILEKYFPGSIRVTFIRATIYESAEKYDDAIRLYRFIIQDNRSCLFALKAKQRLIAISKEFGHTSKVLQDLSTFTQMYSDNYDGWFELYRVNMELGGQGGGEYAQNAILAASHLILLEPENYMSYIYNGDALNAYGEMVLDGMFGSGWEMGEGGHEGERLNSKFASFDPKSAKSDSKNTQTKNQTWTKPTANTNPNTRRMSLLKSTSILGKKLDLEEINQNNNEKNATSNNEGNLNENQHQNEENDLNDRNKARSITSTNAPKATNSNSTNLTNSTKTKTLNSLSTQPLNNMIKIAYDHLINARYYYSTAHHLNPNQLSSLGLIQTSRRIKVLLHHYPQLPHFASTSLKSTSPTTSTPSPTDRNTKTSESLDIQHEIDDCEDLIAIGLDFLKKKMVKNCIESLKIDFANSRRLERGLRPMPRMKLFDPFGAVYWSQCEEFKNCGWDGRGCGGELEDAKDTTSPSIQKNDKNEHTITTTKIDDLNKKKIKND